MRICLVGRGDEGQGSSGVRQTFDSCWSPSGEHPFPSRKPLKFDASEFPGSVDSAATPVERDTTALLLGTISENSRESVTWLVWAAQMWSGTAYKFTPLTIDIHI